MVCSIDQCLREWVVCHPGGNMKWGWPRGVFPLLIFWTGRKLPVKDPQKTAVICRLSVTPTISTCFEPYSSIVQVEKGMTLIPVSSQFKMSLAKILFMLTVANTSFRSVFFAQQSFTDTTIQLLWKVLNYCSHTMMTGILAYFSTNTGAVPLVRSTLRSFPADAGGFLYFMVHFSYGLC